MSLFWGLAYAPVLHKQQESHVLTILTLVWYNSIVIAILRSFNTNPLKGLKIMGKYTLWKANNGQYYWNLKASNGEKICQSEGYVSKQGALNGIDSVKRNASSDTDDLV